MCLIVCTGISGCAGLAHKEPAGLTLPYVPDVPMQVLSLTGGKFSVDGDPITCDELRQIAQHRRPTQLLIEGALSLADIICISSIASELGVSAASVGIDGQLHEIRGHL